MSTFENIIEEMQAVHAKKAHDYAGGSDYGNFLECERAGISAEAGIVTRMSDKWTRLMNLWSRNGEAAVVDENIDDTVLDLANYAVILLAYRRDQKMISESKRV